MAISGSQGRRIKDFEPYWAALCLRALRSQAQRLIERPHNDLGPGRSKPTRIAAVFDSVTAACPRNSGRSNVPIRSARQTAKIKVTRCADPPQPLPGKDLGIDHRAGMHRHSAPRRKASAHHRRRPSA